MRTHAVNSRLAPRHDITVLTSVYRNSRRRVERSGVRYQRLGFRIPPFALSPHFSFLAALGPAVRRSRPDLVIEEFTPPIGFCGLPCWTRAPVILMVQWNFFEQWERRYHLPFRRWMERVARRGRYRYVIVQSDAMARELQSLMPEASIRRIACGIDDDAFTDGHEVGQYVLFLGRLEKEQKGLDLLMRAWSRVCAASGIPLVIAGEGPARAELEAWIQREQLGHLVRLIGRVEGQAKHDALRGARVFAMPSRFETFGITALEAMAAGKPVVCFDIAHLNEFAAAPWAESVPDFDADAFGRAITAWWREPARCQAAGEHARRRARAHRWDEIARQQEEFYLEVVASHSS